MYIKIGDYEIQTDITMESNIWRIGVGEFASIYKVDYDQELYILVEDINGHESFENRLLTWDDVTNYIDWWMFYHLEVA